MKKIITSLALFGLLGGHPVPAVEFDHHIELNQTSAATFYVAGEIKGYGPVSLLVDTGATYSVISEKILWQLRAGGNATSLGSASGVTADGSRFRVSVYRISGITLGGECTIRDVEAVVFPGQARPILGLSALQKVSPFIFSTDPPGLALSNCGREFADSRSLDDTQKRKAISAVAAGTVPSAEVAVMGDTAESPATPKLIKGNDH